MARPLTLVYVEDNEGDVLLMREAFAELRVPVELLVMKNASAALRYFRMKSTRADIPPPNAFLIDYRLPDANGSDLIAYINEDAVLSRVPSFIYVDAHQCERLRVEMKANPGQCLTKPSTWTELLAVVESLAAAMRSTIAG